MALNRRPVGRDVINAVKNLGEDNIDNPSLRWLRLDEEMEIDQVDAIYITGFLDGQLELQKELAKNNNGTNNPKGRWICLYLSGARLTDDAVEVFCDFFRRPCQQRMALEFALPPVQCRRLLHALHANTSVKRLGFWCDHDDFEEDELGRWISDFLRHKTDFETLIFGGAHVAISHLLAFLRSGHSPLKGLGLNNCDLSDDDVQLIIQALMEGNHQSSLELLSISHNHATSRGMGHLCAMAPSVFRCLQRLLVSGNPTLMDDLKMTKRFLQEVLLAPGSILKDLSIANCSKHAAGYVSIIKALETHPTMLRLEMAASPEVAQLIRDQLIVSIPKMNQMREFICGQNFLEGNDQELMKAFSQNSSFRKLRIWHNDDGSKLVPVNTPFLLAILKRNKYLAHVDSLLGTRPSIPASSSTGPVGGRNAPSTPIIIPRSLWPHALAKVDRSSGHGSNHSQGASPVYKILQARLASWPETNEIATTNASKKRKRQDADEKQG